MLRLGWRSEQMHGARPALRHAGGVGRRNGGWLVYLLRDEYILAFLSIIGSRGIFFFPPIQAEDEE